MYLHFSDTLMKLPVLSSHQCVTRDFCSCVRLKFVLSTIVIYSGVILIHVRPVFILYAHATTGYFRDILPSLLQTTMYSFLCFEYVCKVILSKQFSESQYYTEDRKIIYVWRVPTYRYGFVIIAVKSEMRHVTV